MQIQNRRKTKHDKRIILVHNKTKLHQSTLILDISQGLKTVRLLLAS
jgi:hypothetical protein